MAESSNPNNLKWLDWSPQDVPASKVNEKLTRELQEEKARQKSFLEVEADYRGTFVAYHPNRTSGLAYVKFFESYGAKDVHLFEETDGIFQVLRTRKVRLIVMWYARDCAHAIDFMRELTEAKDIERSALLVLCPGDEVVQKFKEDAKALFVDHVTTFVANRANFGKAVASALTECARKDSPRAMLELSHAQWRNILARKPITLPSAEDFQKAIVSLNTPAKEFWFKSEVLSHSILIKKNDAAAADALVKAYPKSILAEILAATIAARAGDIPQASDALIDRIIQKESAGTTPERLYQVAKLMIRWKQGKALGKLLGFWFSLEKLEKNHVFSYLVGTYYSMTNLHDKGRQYYRYAISQSAPRWEYVAGLAEAAFHMKDYVGAEQLWNFAAQTYGADLLMCNIGQLKCHYGLRKIRIAESLLTQLLTENPQHKELQALKKQYMGSRVA